MRHIGHGMSGEGAEKRRRQPKKMGDRHRGTQLRRNESPPGARSCTHLIDERRGGVVHGEVPDQPVVLELEGGLRDGRSGDKRERMEHGAESKYSQTENENEKHETVYADDTECQEP